MRARRLISPAAHGMTCGETTSTPATAATARAVLGPRPLCPPPWVLVQRAGTSLCDVLAVCPPRIAHRTVADCAARLVRFPPTGRSHDWRDGARAYHLRRLPVPVLAHAGRSLALKTIVAASPRRVSQTRSTRLRAVHDGDALMSAIALEAGGQIHRLYLPFVFPSLHQAHATPSWIPPIISLPMLDPRPTACLPPPPRASDPSRRLLRVDVLVSLGAVVGRRSHSRGAADE
ncbi:hypothetical protein K438DRAFT_1992341 [Mycena galopus ATCC 62051]|nr:hypothetical protein K438DRAFT_1992341 [Mycena galopus ATCC 62051]